MQESIKDFLLEGWVFIILAFAIFGISVGGVFLYVRMKAKAKPRVKQEESSRTKVMSVSGDTD